MAKTRRTRHAREKWEYGKGVMEGRYVTRMRYTKARAVNIPVRLALHRSGKSGSFEACASLPNTARERLRGTTPAKGGVHCSRASNPRKAIGAALKRLGKSVSAREGAFAGLERRR